MGLYVTYMDCMECEDKECITKREEQTNVNMGEQSQTKIAKSAHVWKVRTYRRENKRT